MDIVGNVIKVIEVYSKKDQVTLITTDWEPGTYVASINIDGEIIESIKFTLVK